MTVDDHLVAVEHFQDEEELIDGYLSTVLLLKLNYEPSPVDKLLA